MGQCPAPPPAARGAFFSETRFEVFPNPFKDKTTIRFVMEQSGHVTLQVFDLAGREICTLFNDQVEKEQPYEVSFDGTNYPAGIYIYKAVNSEAKYTGKMILKKE